MAVGMAWRCRIAANSAPKRRANRTRFDRAAKSVRRVSVGRPVTTTLRSWRLPRTRTFFVPVIALMSLPMVNPCAMRGWREPKYNQAFSRVPPPKACPKYKTPAEKRASATINTDRILRPSQAGTSVKCRQADRGPVLCPIRHLIGRRSSRGMTDLSRIHNPAMAIPDNYPP
jgi:hypothetical protein